MCTQFFKLMLLFVAVACGKSLAVDDTTTIGPQTVTPCNLICSFIYAPVCGSDGQTYANECIFHSLTCVNGINAVIVHNEACEKIETTTVAPQTVTPCNRICTFIYDPVCGSDGQTYSNECVFRSLTCINGIDAVILHDGVC